MDATKNVEKLPRFAFGNFGPRFGAYLIDVIVIRGFTGLLFNIYMLFGFWNSGARFGLYNISDVLVYLLYFMLFTKFAKGRTLGKMIFGLQVVSLNQETLTWTDVFIREFVGRYIQKKIKLLYLVLFITEKKQTLADVFTDTAVISERAYFELREYLPNNDNQQLVEE